MNTIDHGRDGRSRAAHRLRNLTIGAAVFGVAATGALSVVAAGTQSATGTTITPVVVTTAGDESPAATSPADSTTGAATSAPAVTGSPGPGHASTGGS